MSKKINSKKFKLYEYQEEWIKTLVGGLGMGGLDGGGVGGLKDKTLLLGDMLEFQKLWNIDEK